MYEAQRKSQWDDLELYYSEAAVPKYGDGQSETGG